MFSTHAPGKTTYGNVHGKTERDRWGLLKRFHPGICPACPERIRPPSGEDKTRLPHQLLPSSGQSTVTTQVTMNEYRKCRLKKGRACGKLSASSHTPSRRSIIHMARNHPTLGRNGCKRTRHHDYCEIYGPLLLACPSVCLSNFLASACGPSRR